jgi:hypothetical protein
MQTLGKFGQSSFVIDADKCSSNFAGLGHFKVTFPFTMSLTVATNNSRSACLMRS